MEGKETIREKIINQAIEDILIEDAHESKEEGYTGEWFKENLKRNIGKALEAIESKWILVDSELPERDKGVLCMFKYIDDWGAVIESGPVILHRASINTINGIRDGDINEFMFVPNNGFVISWQPLPTPPKKGE